MRHRIITLGTMATMALAGIIVGWAVLPACSGTQQQAAVAEQLRRLPDAVTAAREALDAARPVLEAAGETEAERLAVSRALDAMDGVLELGEALTHDLARASERGGWAWASAILGAISGVLGLLKGFDVPIPDAVMTAAGAADLLLPVLEGAVGAET